MTTFLEDIYQELHKTELMMKLFHEQQSCGSTYNSHSLKRTGCINPFSLAVLHESLSAIKPSIDRTSRRRPLVAMFITIEEEMALVGKEKLGEEQWEGLVRGTHLANH